MKTLEAEARDWARAGLIHLGEAEALALARQERTKWRLTDDGAARVMAVQLALEVHGSLGVLLWGAATGLLDFPAAETGRDRTRHSSLWGSPRVVDEARRALDQIFARSPG